MACDQISHSQAGNMQETTKGGLGPEFGAQLPGGGDRSGVEVRRRIWKLGAAKVRQCSPSVLVLALFRHAHSEAQREEKGNVSYKLKGIVLNLTELRIRLSVTIDCQPF